MIRLYYELTLGQMTQTQLPTLSLPTRAANKPSRSRAARGSARLVIEPSLSSIFRLVY